MKGDALKGQRGSILLFTTMSLTFILIMGGIAIDLAYFSAARAELQRSMDAAALAGAGNLGFDGTVFSTVRSQAWRFANLNPYRVGTVNLGLNSGNDSNGDIVLGIWDRATFTPSVDGTRVNAVRCQYATQIPTSFLRLLGLNTLAVSAQSTAVSNPPRTVPPESCLFPLALNNCGFDPASSTGCGDPVTFITSSGGSGSPPLGTNTAAWANPCGTSTPGASETRAMIRAAADPDQDCNSCTPKSGTDVGTSNGMQQSVYDLLEQTFIQQYNTGDFHQATDSTGATTYDGPGWKVLVPVVATACPTQAFNGPHEIVGWSEFVMTQVINKGKCAVNNPYDPRLATVCPNAGNPALRGLTGYFRCTYIDSLPDQGPGPRSALARRMRLVQ